MPACVYLVWAEGTPLVKVGYSESPVARVSGLQTGCPYRLHIMSAMYGTQSMEREIHKWMAPIRVNGEWFDLSLLTPKDIIAVSQLDNENPFAMAFGAFLPGAIKVYASKALMPLVHTCTDRTIVDCIITVLGMCFSADGGRMIAYSDESVRQRLRAQAAPIAFGRDAIPYEELVQIRM